MTDRSVSISLIARVQGYVAGMKTAQLATSKLTAEIAASAKKQQALRELGNAAGAMGLAAAAGLFLVVKAAANFDQSMSRVAATGQDAKDNLDALRTAAIAAGQATVFSATEAADGVTELLKAGVSAKDVLSGGLLASLNLASAGELGVADAANIMATALSQFNLPGSDAAHVADLLAAAAGKAQGDVTDMAQALKYVGPVANSMGVSIEETTGVIAELANKGILADQAGTSMRGMLTALTSPSKIAAKELATLGINLYDATGNFVGFRGIAEQLHGTLGKLSNATRDQALGQIFGNQQITAARILYEGGGKAVDSWMKKVNDSGYATDAAKTKLDNLMGDLEQLRGSLETAFIGTGDSSQSPLRVMVQDLTALVNLYSSLPGPVKTGVAMMALLTAAIGLTAFAASRAVIAFGAMKTNMETLGITAGTASKQMIAARGGALALGIGLAVLNSHVDDSHAALKGMLSIGSGVATGFAVGGPWGAAIGGAGGLLQALGESSAQAAARQEQLKQAAGGVGAALDQQTGALTDNTAAAAAQALAQSGAYEAAKKFGISQDDITSAALGNAAALGRVKDSLDKFGTGPGADVLKGTILDPITASTDAIGTARDGIDATGAAAEAAVPPVNSLAQGVADAAAATKVWTDDLKALNDVLSGRSDMRAYQAAIDAASDALKKNGKTLDIHTAAGRENAATLDDIASSAISVAQSMNEDGKHTKQANAYLEQSRKTLIATAEGFGMSEKAAKAYADRVLDIPKVVKTTAQLNAEAAKRAADNLKTYIENLDPMMTIHEQHVAGRTGTSATGGTVTGGIPGKDSVLKLLMPGEEVIRTSAANRHRPLLKAINAGAMADGGTVGMRYAHPGGTDSSLTAQMAGMRAELRAISRNGIPVAVTNLDGFDRRTTALAGAVVDDDRAFASTAGRMR